MYEPAGGMTVLTSIPAIGMVTAVLCGLYIYYQSRGWKLSWSGAGGMVVSLFLVVPIAAVVGYLFLRIPLSLRNVDHHASEAVASPATAIDVPKAENPEVTRPAWVDEELDDGKVVVVGKPNLDRKRAEDNALLTAWQKVIETLHRDKTFAGGLQLQPSDVRPLVEGEPYAEAVVSRTGSSTFTTYRVHLLVDLSASGRERLRPIWKRQIVQQRLWMLGGLGGMLTLMFGTTAAYLRLDDLTNGMYRLRLKFAATSLIVSGGLIAVVLTTA